MEEVIGMLEKMYQSTLKMNRENGMNNFDLWLDRKQAQGSNHSASANQSNPGF